MFEENANEGSVLLERQKKAINEAFEEISKENFDLQKNPELSQNLKNLLCSRLNNDQSAADSMKKKVNEQLELTELMLAAVEELFEKSAAIKKVEQK